MKTSEVGILVTGLLTAGILLGAFLQFESMSKSIHMDARDLGKMVRSCEADLPRNQTCKLVAVPNTEKTNAEP